MEKLRVHSFGPIQKAEVEIGDLTLLIGQQGSGKSLFLQLMKVLIDKKHIRKNLEQYNYTWKNEENTLLQLYFGEGMHYLWGEHTKVFLDEKEQKKTSCFLKRETSIRVLKKECFTFLLKEY